MGRAHFSFLGLEPIGGHATEVCMHGRRYTRLMIPSQPLSKHCHSTDWYSTRLCCLSMATRIYKNLSKVAAQLHPVPESNLLNIDLTQTVIQLCHPWISVLHNQTFVFFSFLLISYFLYAALLRVTAMILSLYSALCIFRSARNRQLSEHVHCTIQELG